MAEPKQEEEEVKQSIVSAEVTGVQTIKVTMATNVASLDNVKVTLKKNSSVKDSTATCEGKVITIKTDTKLTAGDYTITIAGLTVEDLTATVNVEKNEYLKEYKIDEHLIAGGTYVNTWGYVYYSALNQYGEMMNADKPTVTCSFATKTRVDRTASATQEGIIEIGKSGTTSEQIPATLAIAGTTGTIVLVDSNNGVNNSANITWSAAATADKVDVAGMYSTAKSKFRDIVAQDNPSDYFYLFKITDQYGHEMDFNKVKNDLQMTVAGGITKLELKGATIGTYLKDFTIGSDDYLALMFKSATTWDDLAKSGDATLTIVNNKKGLLLTQTITVADYVVITNFTATDDNGLYADKKNELSFEATDSEGNSVTSFDVLSRTVEAYGAPLYWEKKDDGSAKLICDLRGITKSDLSISENDSHTGNVTKAFTFYCNEPTSNKYMVKTYTFNIYQDREVKSVLGVKADTTTQFSITDGKLDISFKKFVFADQYANKITDADGELWSKAMKTLLIDRSGSNGISWSQVNTGVTVAQNDAAEKFTFESDIPSATATLYFKNLCKINGGNTAAASVNNYDYRLVVTAVDTTKIDNESIKLDSINGGYTVKADPTGDDKTPYVATITESALSVSGLVAGSKTAIPTSQLKIQSVSNNSFSDSEVKSGVKTKTASAVVQVTTFDASNNTIIKTFEKDFQVSYAPSYAFELTGVDSDIYAAGNTITGLDIQKVLVFKDQYGVGGYKNTTSQAGEKLTYKVVAQQTTAVQVTGENVANISVLDLIGDPNVGHVLSVTINTPNGKKENKTITGWFTAAVSGYNGLANSVSSQAITSTTATTSGMISAISSAAASLHAQSSYTVAVTDVKLNGNKVEHKNTYTYTIKVTGDDGSKLEKTFTGVMKQEEIAIVTFGSITAAALVVGGDASAVTGNDLTVDVANIGGQSLTVASTKDEVATSIKVVSGTAATLAAGDVVELTVVYDVPTEYTYVDGTTAFDFSDLAGNWKVKSAVQSGAVDAQKLTVVFKLTI